MEVSHVRRRLTAEIERLKKASRERRERVAATERAYETFVSDVAVPVTRMVANVLKADGYLARLRAKGYTLEEPL